MRRVRSRRSQVYVVSIILLAYSVISAYTDTKTEGNANGDFADLTLGAEDSSAPSPTSIPGEGFTEGTVSVQIRSYLFIKFLICDTSDLSKFDYICVNI